MEEFINLFQGGTSVVDNSLMFTKLSKYAPSLVLYPRNEMSPFLMGVSNELVGECYSSMLHDNMNISDLMVHAQQVKETRLRRKNKESKKGKPYEGASSKGRLHIQEKFRFKKRISN